MTHPTTKPTNYDEVEEETYDQALDDLRHLQDEVGEWARENFGEEQPDTYPLMGVSEEVGELNHSVLKQLQGIRLDEEGVGEDAELDAVGDIIIYLCDFCERRGLSIAEAVELAWYDEVKNREWDADVEVK